ncbi:MAG: hypothetical protein RL326_2246 [Pseudomonadota bacterium]|jgi:hypothetical protein
MISIVRSKYGIPINEIFFSEDPLAAEAESSIQFFVQARRPVDGFNQFKTPIINLKSESGVLFSSLSSSTRYKIRRAEREGYIPSVVGEPTDADIHSFCGFFDPFAAQKKLSPANKAKLNALRLKNHLVLSSVNDKEGHTVAMHAYVVDSELERVRLLYSASHFRESANSEERNAIGRANRLLHWHEIETLSRAGYTTYDLGGIPINDSDPEKNAIARFKSEFGGTHLIEFNGIVCHNLILRSGLSLLRRIRA